MKKILSFLVTMGMTFILVSCNTTGIGETGISLDEYNRLKTGMSLSEVKSIIGGDGEIISDEDKSTDNYYEHIYIYKFLGETSGYAEIEFKIHFDSDEFINALDTGELSKKTQFNLK